MQLWCLHLCFWGLTRDFCPLIYEEMNQDWSPPVSFLANIKSNFISSINTCKGKHDPVCLKHQSHRLRGLLAPIWQSPTKRDKPAFSSHIYSPVSNPLGNQWVLEKSMNPTTGLQHPDLWPISPSNCHLRNSEYTLFTSDQEQLSGCQRVSMAVLLSP